MRYKILPTKLQHFAPSAWKCHNRSKVTKQSEKKHQGLYNVGFVGRENESTLFENSPKHLDEINENS